MSSFGLGYGVDASDVDILRNRHGKVRDVLNDLSNVEERAINRRDKYEQHISTIKSHKETINVSVSDISGDVINISAIAEYSRERTRELVATGKERFNIVMTWSCLVLDYYLAITKF